MTLSGIKGATNLDKSIPGPSREIMTTFDPIRNANVTKTVVDKIPAKLRKKNRLNLTFLHPTWIRHPKCCFKKQKHLLEYLVRRLEFLTHLVIHDKIAASTQNQAMKAVVWLCKVLRLFQCLRI